MNKYEIGINTDCECGETFKETLQNIKAAGFRNIMLSEKSGDLEECLSIAREMKLEIPAVHLGYREPHKNINDMWKKDRTNREFVKDFTRRLRILNKYNVKTAVIHPHCSRDCDGALHSIQQAVSTLEKLLSVAQELGISIAVENLADRDTTFTCMLLENIKAPNFGFCYDCGHKNLYTPGKNLLKTYGNRCIAIHLHDNLMDDKTFNDVDRDLHYLPFDGKINFQNEMSEIAASSYDGVIMLEVHRFVYKTNEPYPIYRRFSITDYLKQANKCGQRLAEIFATKKA